MTSTVCPRHHRTTCQCPSFAAAQTSRPTLATTIGRPVFDGRAWQYPARTLTA